MEKNPSSAVEMVAAAPSSEASEPPGFLRREQAEAAKRSTDEGRKSHEAPGLFDGLRISHLVNQSLWKLPKADPLESSYERQIDGYFPETPLIRENSFDSSRNAMILYSLRQNYHFPGWVLPAVLLDDGLSLFRRRWVDGAFHVSHSENPLILKSMEEIHAEIVHRHSAEPNLFRKFLPGQAA